MMTARIPRIAVSVGEPAGIGPDIVLQWAQHPLNAHVVVFADATLLAQRAAQLGLTIQLTVGQQHSVQLHQPHHLAVIPVPLSQPVHCGQLNSAHAPAVLTALRRATQACLDNHFDALVTAPLHKGIINAAGIRFSGHTEFLAQLTQTEKVVMMLATPQLRVALVTTHLPLTQVSAAITPTHLHQVIHILHQALQRDFGLAQPHIAVCGLNPHAGEDGYLGQEELLTITPVLTQLRAQGMQLTGPVPADSAFTPTALSTVDAVLAMYHDQGLPVLKQQGFGEAVNITLGLPIIRTSVDHGTALALAGTGRALSTSLHRALEMAIQLIHNRDDSLCTQSAV
ncbi:MAG: 4-hydroxythreonine-4-phosphate dehydrogenase PdxA [Pseudomonadota bacterium]|nr:4-hydroxythreonine-4-phosphate dehydrogenase PdxA [Pseudomonadota bacterium]